MANKLWSNAIIRNLLVALAYGVLGKIGVSLAIPPGYATLIWLSSGVALFAVLQWSWRILPGVALGSMLVNFSFDASDAGFSVLLQSLLIPFVIALGAAVQAFLGAWLLRKYARFPNQLNDERSIFLFLFWGGAVACLFNPIWSTSALLFVGAIQPSEYLLNMTTWWAGDVVGVAVSAPILLVWTFTKATNWLRRALTVTSSVFLAFVVTVYVVSMSASWERQRLQLEFESLVDLAGVSLSRTFENHADVLHYMEGFAASTDNMNRSNFKEFSSRFLRNFEGLQALSWNPLIVHSERDKFEASVRAEGFDDFTIKERDTAGELAPAQVRPNYVSVRFIEPFDANRSAFGFDVGSNEARRQAFEAAIDSGDIIATQRTTLVQESEKQFGVLAFMPVYRGGSVPPDVQSRRANIKGFMVAVFRGGDIVETALADFATDQFVLQLNDRSAPEGEQFLLENLSQDKGQRELQEQGFFGGSERLEKTFEINFGGRLWEAEFFPSKRYVTQNRERNAWLPMAAGLFFTIIVGIFVLLVSGREERLNTLVENQTKDLVLSEKRLEAAQEIASIGSWEYDIGQNELWCSNEVLTILGVDEAPKEMNIDYLSDFFHPDDRSRVRGNLRIDNLTESAKSFEHRLVCSNEQIKNVLQHVELVYANGHPSKVMGTVQDISELRKLDRLKTEFVATVSHELRTPLTSIKGALGMLAGGVIADIPEKASGLVKIAYANCERLANLVDDLLDINGIMAGNIVLQNERIELKALVQKAVTLNQLYAEQHNATFSIDYCEPNLMVFADPARLMQVVTNLLSNAAKFSNSPGQVSIRIERVGENAKILISDDGEGVPSDFRSKIFNRFSQADGSETRQQGGAGLGLYISKEIVLAMNGSIDYESPPGDGATFYVELPLTTHDSG